MTPGDAEPGPRDGAAAIQQGPRRDRGKSHSLDSSPRIAALSKNGQRLQPCGYRHRCSADQGTDAYAFPHVAVPQPVVVGGISLNSSLRRLLGSCFNSAAKRLSRAIPSMATSDESTTGFGETSTQLVISEETIGGVDEVARLLRNDAVLTVSCVDTFKGDGRRDCWYARSEECECLQLYSGAGPQRCDCDGRSVEERVEIVDIIPELDVGSDAS
jgi:hypothetical protein